jgi:hypothetical protein
MSTLHGVNVRLAAIGIGAAVFAGYLFNYFRKRYNYWNSPFLEAGRVQQLFVYPIKSCKGVEVSFCNGFRDYSCLDFVLGLLGAGTAKWMAF